MRPQQKFKPGDKVVCADSTLIADRLTEGRQYVVQAYHLFVSGQRRGWLIWLEEDDTGKRCSVYEDRFSLVISEG